MKQMENHKSVVHDNKDSKTVTLIMDNATVVPRKSKIFLLTSYI